MLWTKKSHTVDLNMGIFEKTKSYVDPVIYMLNIFQMKDVFNTVLCCPLQDVPTIASYIISS